MSCFLCVLAATYSASQLANINRLRTDEQAQVIAANRSSRVGSLLPSSKHRGPTRPSDRPILSAKQLASDQSHSSIAALIPEDQNIDDDWLIRDIMSPKHKRNY